MSEENGKARNIQEVQRELARAKSMDDFFGKEGIFRTSHIAPVAQYLDHKPERSPVFSALPSGIHNMLMIRCIIQLQMATR
jgi:hypothetical protein